jgi:hypothetical protein
VGVIDPLLHDRHRLEQHGEILNSFRDLVEEHRVLDVVLRHEPVAPHDAALGVLAAAAHVALAGAALRALAAWAAHGGHDDVPGLPSFDALADFFDDAEILVAEDQKLVPRRRLAVDAVIDLGVGRAQADTQHLYRDLGRAQLRIRHLPHVDAVLEARLHDDRVHGSLIEIAQGISDAFTFARSRSEI